jgi:hypothetical protein
MFPESCSTSATMPPLATLIGTHYHLAERSSTQPCVNAAPKLTPWRGDTGSAIKRRRQRARRALNLGAHGSGLSRREGDVPQAVVIAVIFSRLIKSRRGISVGNSCHTRGRTLHA